MLLRAIGFITLLVVLTACSNDEPAIVKVENPKEEVKDEPELIEEVKDDEQIEEFIEFQLNDEVLRVNLEQIPILKAYLQAVEDKQAVIEKMDIQHIMNKDGNDIYLFEFSCQDNECSYLLLDQNSENTGILVADFATFENFNLSPDETTLMLKFSRKSTKDDILPDLVIIDLKDWEILPIVNDAVDINLFDFNQHILSASWIDEESITVSFPSSVISRLDLSEEINNNQLTFYIGKQ